MDAGTITAANITANKAILTLARTFIRTLHSVTKRGCCVHFDADRPEVVGNLYLLSYFPTLPHRLTIVFTPVDLWMAQAWQSGVAPLFHFLLVELRRAAVAIRFQTRFISTRCSPADKCPT
jgi:hypothetical protein